MAKTSKEYSEILKTLLQIEISELGKELEKEEEEEQYFTRGQIMGLEMAIGKIDSSKFLVED